MSIPIRFTRFQLGAIIALLISVYFLNNEHFGLPIWPPLTWSIGSWRVTDLLALLSFLIYFYFLHRHNRKINPNPINIKQILIRFPLILAGVIASLFLTLFVIALVAG